MNSVFELDPARESTHNGNSSGGHEEKSSPELSDGEVVSASGQSPSCTARNMSDSDRSLFSVAVKKEQLLVFPEKTQRRIKPHGTLAVGAFCTPNLEDLLSRWGDQKKHTVIVYKERDDKQGFDILQIYLERFGGWHSQIVMWVHAATGVYSPLAKYIGRKIFWADLMENFFKETPGVSCSTNQFVEEEVGIYVGMMLDLIQAIQPTYDLLQKIRQDAKERRSSPRSGSVDRRRNKEK